MCLFGCKCEERFEHILSGKANKDYVESLHSARRRNDEWTSERIRILIQKVEILEHMFKESKPYKRAECEVLRKHAKQG